MGEGLGRDWRGGGIPARSGVQASCISSKGQVPLTRRVFSHLSLVDYATLEHST